MLGYCTARFGPSAGRLHACLRASLISGPHGRLPAGLHGWLLAAAGGTPTQTSIHNLGLAALGSWLLAESLGAYMLTNWFGRGRGADAGPDRMPMPFLLGHAGMAFSGLVCWVIFLATTSPIPAWLALGFLVPAIGFGISTVTVWTPYPGRRADPEGASAEGRDTGGLGAGTSSHATADEPWHERRGTQGVIPDVHVHRALDDAALTSKLVDDLLARNLGHDPPPRRARLDPRPLIPLAHGVFALATILLTTLAAATATVY